MTSREVHLELLLGKQVVDSTGAPVGRIEEICAESQGDETVVREYLVGGAALLERLSAWTIGMAMLRLLGASKLDHGYRIPWNKLDLTDPERPRLSCSVRELDTLVD